ncbi:unnamed protein product, partial [Ectocarpus sp. 12 AP-2014]
MIASAGAIPSCLGSLQKLQQLELGLNQLAGGPAIGEGLDSWRARMRLQQKTKQQTLKGDEKEEASLVPPTPPPHVCVFLPQQREIDEGRQEARGRSRTSPFYPSG